jgi:hypothetical protein
VKSNVGSTILSTLRNPYGNELSQIITNACISKIIHDEESGFIIRNGTVEQLPIHKESWFFCPCIYAKILREREMERIKLTGVDANLEKEEMINEMNLANRLDGENVNSLMQLLFCDGFADKTIDTLSDDEVVERSYLIQKAILLISVHAAECKASISRRSNLRRKNIEEADKKYKPIIKQPIPSTSKAAAKINPETALAIVAASLGIPIEAARKLLNPSSSDE